MPQHTTDQSSVRQARPVTRVEVLELVMAGRATVVDALPAEYYTRRHIPGAVNLVAEDVDRKAAQLLPDPAATVVTYCSNRACANSTQVARRLLSLGYTDVRTYHDGLEDWVAAELPVEGDDG